MARLLVLLLMGAATVWAQPGFSGGSGRPKACVGAPGDTKGALRDLCVSSAGLVYACKQAGGCTLAAHWQGQEGTGAAVPGSSGQIIFNDDGALNADAGLAFNKAEASVGIKGPLSLGQAGFATGSVNLHGSTSGTANITTNSTGAAIVFDKPIAGNAGLTLGQTGGTGATIAMNGADSGTATFSVAADGSGVTLDRTLSVGATVIGATSLTGTVPRVLHAAWADTAQNMISTDGGVYNSISSTNGCPAGSCAPTAFSAAYTIPANYLIAGKILRVTYSCYWIGAGTPPSVTLQIRLGATVLSTSPAVSIVSGQSGQYALQFLIVGTSAPSSSSIVDVAPIVGFSFQGRNNSSPATVATNSSLAISLLATWSAATGGNMFQVRGMMVEEIN